MDKEQSPSPVGEEYLKPVSLPFVRYASVALLALASLFFLVLGFGILFAALKHPGHSQVDLRGLEAAGIFLAFGFVSVTAMAYLWRGVLSATGRTLLPAWLILGFGAIVAAALLGSAYVSGWKDFPWATLSCPILFIVIGVVLARKRRAK